MRRFKWRLFERKGLSKEEIKSKKILQRNIEDIKKEIFNKSEFKNVRELAREILAEEN